MTQLTPYQQNALEYKHHISLTANAGSGKTFVLSKRYLNIALSENIPINKIIAITFTEKAASELYKKIAGEIDSQLSEDISEDKRQQLSLFRRQLVSANISTIHSFCINILKEFSPEAGIDANFTPIDQITADEILEMCLEELFEELSGESNFAEDLRYLIRFLGSNLSAYEVIKSLVKNRRIAGDLADSLYKLPEEDIAAIFLKNFEKEFSEIYNIDFEQIYQAIIKINDHAFATAKTTELAVTIKEIMASGISTDTITGKLIELNKIKEFLITSSSGAVKSRGYLSAKNREQVKFEIEIVENFYHEIKDLVFSNSPQKANLILAQFGKKLSTVFLQLIELYDSKKRSKGFLDFEDLLLTTKSLMKNNDVIKKLSEKYEYVMIDEFQDTNELQYEIVMPILENLKTGNLFVVGDEKQSIYRFRGAEPEIFDKTKSEIEREESPEYLLNLPHSFRVSAKIAAFTNYLFKRLFSDANTKFNEVMHNELVSARPEIEVGEIEFLITSDDEEALTEAELIARKILALKNRGEEFHDIAILCRKRKSFKELEDALSQSNIPYTISAGKGFFQKQFIADIFHYLSFLITQNDDLALIGILRSPFYNISDIKLYEISLEYGENFWQKTRSRALNDEVLKEAVRLLDKHCDSASRNDFTQLLRKILNDTAYISVIASRSDHEQELANIEKIIGIASNYSKQGFKSLYDFKEYLSEAINKLFDEGQADVSGQLSSVNIMTIHQSKGLEFKSLFLYKCNEAGKQDRVQSRSISVDKDYGILTKVPITGSYFETPETPPISALYNYVTTRKNLAEIKRLFYVAVTRAVDNLYICATVKKNGFVKYSFMEMIAQAINSDFDFDELKINYNQEFMYDSSKKFERYFQSIELNIPIIHNIESVKIEHNSDRRDEKTEKKVISNEIKDFEEGEIVSATKIATFTQCPVKYQLTYEYGYGKLLRLLNNPIDKRDAFTDDFDDSLSSELPGDVRGRIIHSIFENEIEPENLRDELKQRISEDNQLYNDCSMDVENLYKKLKTFYDSEIYKNIRNYKNYYNEYEAYVKIDNYYLYGIIDKLIIKDEELLIVDYKSDVITHNEISDKAANYLPQLKFYAYLLTKLFPDKFSFQLMLLFVEHPESPVIENQSKEQLDLIGLEIKEIVSKIRLGDFCPNHKHCKKCHFFFTSNCNKSIK